MSSLIFPFANSTVRNIRFRVIFTEYSVEKFSVKKILCRKILCQKILLTGMAPCRTILRIMKPCQVNPMCAQTAYSAAIAACSGFCLGLWWHHVLRAV